MADVVHESETKNVDTKELVHDTVKEENEMKDAVDIESQIMVVMRSRVSYFKDQADALTFEGVRRLLEEDLGLEKYSLDVHKRYIKDQLLECLNHGNDDNASEKDGETGEKNISAANEAVESPEGPKSKKNVKEPGSEDEGKMEDSPVMGLLSVPKTTKSETNGTQCKEDKEELEDEIKKGLKKRASYVKDNSENITMAGLRRLLEEDLKLDKHTLDPYKKFISEQLDQVLKASEVPEPVDGNTKKNPKKKPLNNKTSNKSGRKESSDSSEGESEEEEDHVKSKKKIATKGKKHKSSRKENSDSSEGESDEEEDHVKSKKKIATKGKTQNSEGLKKRKRPEKETKVSGKKKSKSVERNTEDNSDAQDSEISSEDGRSQSSAERSIKKKEVSTPLYGKRVNKLRLVIKQCALSIPPLVYRKVKQVSENKREATLIKELEEILAKEGLSSNPSEKGIKDVRKRKERAKELEGIDTSNIVSSSRRRSTTSFVPPPKPKVLSGSEEEDGEDTENDVEADDDDSDDDSGADESQSEEEFNEGEEDSD